MFPVFVPAKWLLHHMCVGANEGGLLLVLHPDRVPQREACVGDVLTRGVEEKFILTQRPFTVQTAAMCARY